MQASLIALYPADASRAVYFLDSVEGTYSRRLARNFSILNSALLGNTDSEILTADIAHWGWVTSAGWAGVDIDEFPHLKAWDDKMLARPGVEKGRHVPDRHGIKELLKDPVKMKEHAEKSRAWVQQGMADDAKK